jgi:hypothetical protein
MSIKCHKNEIKHEKDLKSLTKIQLIKKDLEMLNLKYEDRLNL